MASTFERFTPPIRRVLILAEDEANKLGHERIGTEHILLGLLREDDSVAIRAFEGLDITIERVRAEVVRIVGRGDNEGPRDISLTPRASVVTTQTLGHAEGLGWDYIAPQHIMLRIVRARDCIAARILRNLGVSGSAIHEEVKRVLHSSSL
jgi:ATP-dependent Clp protease ATP-binding subunit ClpC